MIRLSEAAAAETIDIALPGRAITKMVDGKRTKIIPVITIDKPSTAAWRVAFEAAREVLPGRDADESESDYLVRASGELGKLNLQSLVERVGMKAGINGVVEALAYALLATALVRSWTGFGDADGNPVEPSAEYVVLAMKDDYIARCFETAVQRPIYAVTSEGNA